MQSISSKKLRSQEFRYEDITVRVLTLTDKEATLHRTNDGWVNWVFEGSRSRGEDWHPAKIDDAVKAV